MITDKADMILWQTSEQDGVPEPALALTQYSDVFQIEQVRDDEHNILNINYESVPELIKLLRKVKVPE